MLRVNAGLKDFHNYQSRPLEWPLLLRGISFWVRSVIEQIYFLGNPLVWWASAFGVPMFCGSWFASRLRMRRGLGVEEGTWRRFGLETVWLTALGVEVWSKTSNGCAFLFLGWLLHYAPFFPMDRCLFLHHYLAAYLFSMMLFAGFVDTIIAGSSSQTKWAACCVIMAIFAWSFVYFMPLAYGTPFASQSEVADRKWLSGWDFIIVR